MIIKENPEDFVVKEILRLKGGNGKYAYFLMKKRNWNTLNAIEELSRRLRIPFKSFGYAGNKDKNAVTEQHISMFNVTEDRVDWIRVKDIWLTFLGYGFETISLGSLEGNDFEIVVKDIDGIGKIEFVANYFDEQRFSKNNIEIGKMIVKRQFKEMCKKLELKVEKNDYIGTLRKLGIRRLQFYLHSYQSWLWNLVLSKHLEQFKHFKVKYSHGNFVFLHERIKNIDLPLINFNTKFKDKEIEKEYNEVMKKEGIGKVDFLIREIPELVTEGISRKAFIGVNWDSVGYDKEKREAKVKFYLPKGSYATIVLKKATNRKSF